MQSWSYFEFATLIQDLEAFLKWITFEKKQVAQKEIGCERE